MALPSHWASPRRTIIMKRIHQNRPKEGIFLKMLYVPDRANGDFSVIHDSERCVIINHSSCIISDGVA